MDAAGTAPPAPAQFQPLPQNPLRQGLVQLGYVLLILHSLKDADISTAAQIIKQKHRNPVMKKKMAMIQIEVIGSDGIVDVYTCFGQQCQKYRGHAN